MLIFTPEGPPSVDDREVLFVYRDETDGSPYVTATFCLSNGNEITGRVLIAALDALETKLDDAGPPPNRMRDLPSHQHVKLTQELRNALTELSNG